MGGLTIKNLSTNHCMAVDRRGRSELEAVAGNDPLDLPVIPADDQGAVAIDVDGLPLKGLVDGPDGHPLIKRQGKTLPLADDGIVLPILKLLVAQFKLPQDPDKKRYAVDLVADLSLK